MKNYKITNPFIGTLVILGLLLIICISISLTILPVAALVWLILKIIHSMGYLLNITFGWKIVLISWLILGITTGSFKITFKK